ncbi:hypothetical protein B0T16DRAFT_458356 [Cercophora newfieldiana]|uniref:Uncharacterized protein n=1 Tax=Cercophora newfieldiana TaxID=92897 RepID=A0AA39Y657_9PEZI|nr:hypothetical protein B0T16DRAFT_458356 [Cercophora newfieldiana]
MAMGGGRSRKSLVDDGAPEKGTQGWGQGPTFIREKLYGFRGPMDAVMRMIDAPPSSESSEYDCRHRDQASCAASRPSYLCVQGTSKWAADDKRPPVGVSKASATWWGLLLRAGGSPESADSLDFTPPSLPWLDLRAPFFAIFWAPAVVLSSEDQIVSAVPFGT